MIWRKRIEALAKMFKGQHSPVRLAYARSESSLIFGTSLHTKHYNAQLIIAFETKYPIRALGFHSTRPPYRVKRELKLFTAMF